ncbi:MAG: bifunctional phosphopantothenoylcysteine decarboxylase/phosphopantothenate--cysteine ligase CoaBC [Acidimicrobiales bacterium]
MASTGTHSGSADLHGRRVVLGVTGGIAAYKAVEVCRRLVDAGAHVSPILTRGALRFVGETTFSALASERVQTSLWDEDSVIPHTRLGQQADLILVCPATARLIGTYAAGISNDLLTATLLASRAPVMICPAMHTEMWEHPAVQDNLALLARRGVHQVAPAEGRLAGGDIGRGRLAEPADVVAAVTALLCPAPQTHSLQGWNVVISSGGTREAIDPVRFIGNRSSGKQGHALALEAHARGASVTLVTTVDRPVPDAITQIRVESAEELRRAMVAAAPAADLVVMAAAVADFRPVTVATGKIKKDGGVPQIVLEQTPDILAGLGATKPPGQILVGFAAETSDLRNNALSKLTRKNADLIVANDVSAPQVGFEHDTNQVVILRRNGSDDVETIDVPLSDKRQVAAAVLDAVQTLAAQRGAR